MSRIGEEIAVFPQSCHRLTASKSRTSWADQGCKARTRRPCQAAGRQSDSVKAPSDCPTRRRPFVGPALRVWVGKGASFAQGGHFLVLSGCAVRSPAGADVHRQGRKPLEHEVRSGCGAPEGRSWVGHRCPPIGDAATGEGLPRAGYGLPPLRGVKRLTDANVLE